MVFGVGGDGTCLAVALKTDVAVFVAFHSRVCPIAYAVLVAKGGIVMTFQFLGNALRTDVGQFGKFGQSPQTRTVSKVGVGHKDDGGHILEGYLTSLVGILEAVGTGGCCNHYSRTFAISAI